jgi:hypothetical protein
MKNVTIPEVGPPFRAGFGFKPRCFLNFHALNIERPPNHGFPEFVIPLPFFAKWTSCEKYNR